MPKISELKRFNITDYLDSDQAIAEYLTVVIEENDPNALIEAIETVARVKGSAHEIQGLDKNDLRFESVANVLKRLGFRLAATAISAKTLPS